MATITAEPGTKTAFLGGVDIIQCLPPSCGRQGIQIVSSGFDLTSATVEVKPLGGSTWQTKTAEASSPNSLTVGRGDHVEAVRISGVAGGSYFVTFFA